jgi:MFS family permease
LTAADDDMAGRDDESVGRRAQDVPAGTSTAFQDWRVWVACLIYFSCTSGIYGLGFWLPTIIADMGVKSTLEIGMLTAIPYAVAAVGMVLVGRSSDKQLERRWRR